METQVLCFSKSEMLKAGMLEKSLAGGAIGAVAGFSLGLVRGFLSQPGFIERLDPRPESFDVDASVAKVFFDLGKYRYVDEQAYVESLHNADSLFTLGKGVLKDCPFKTPA